MRTGLSGKRSGDGCSQRGLIAVGDKEGAARRGLHLQHRRCGGIGKAGHADQIECIDLVDRAAR